MSSFLTDRVEMDGLTFDDVLLIPAYSEVLPKSVNLQSKFSRNITLNVPLVSAAMDTVTEAKMAIAIAREGGIGVIHKNMSIQEQARQVHAVKRAENGMIYDPVTIRRGATVGDALSIMEEYHIGGIPVVDENRMLVGIVTNRDLRFERDLNRKIDEVMTTENLVTTSQSTNLEEAADILQSHKIEKLPVVDKEGHLVGLVTYKDITKAKDKPNACKDALGRLRVAAGVGVTADSMERVDALVAAGVDAIVIDTAHGHSAGVVGVLRAVKEKYPQIDVVVGNIATGAAARFLAENGADGVKVGIGPGSICTTRVIAGVGVPQLSAVYDVAKALEGTGVPLIADKNFREIYGLYMKTGFDALSAYNIYLETAVESGIFALIAFLGFLVTLSKDAVQYVLKSCDIEKVIFVSTAITAIWAVMFHGLVDTIYFRPQLQFMFWTYVAVISIIAGEK